MRALSVLMMLMSCGVLIAGDVDFSGVWELDQARSELPQAGGRGGKGEFNAVKMVVTQDENKVVIERHIKDRDGEERIVTSNLTLDGKAVKEESGRGAREVKAELQGDELLLNSIIPMERQGRSFKIKTRQKWSLVDDGKGLVIEFTMDTPRGERKGKAYYHKK